MNRRSLLLILVAILVAAAAVPAFGAGTETVSPTFDRKASVRALAKARLALLTARSAKSASRRAVRTAEAAQIAAGEAKSQATATQTALDATRIQSALASGRVSTESGKYVQLPGGPSLTVTAPSSGLVEVWAQVSFNGEPGAVGLFEDGQLMAGQSEHCTPELEEEPALLAAFSGELLTVSTPTVFNLIGACGVEGPPSGVLFQTSPGQHTYELRYRFVECGCPGAGEPGADFSKRLLRVGPRL